MLPFTREQFYAVFESYNRAVWPMQVVLVGFALAAIVALRVRPKGADRAVSAVLAFLWVWTGIAYHAAFFSRINPAARLFAALFLAGAASFLWSGAIRGSLRFEWKRGSGIWLGGALLAYSLVLYPLIGLALGHRYPATPTFGAPCPTTIYTMGVLCFLRREFPRHVFAAPLVWTVIGGSAAFLLGVWGDLGLVVAFLIGITRIGRWRRAQR